MIDILLRFFAPFIYFVSLAVSLATLSKRSFGKVLPLALILPSFFLFFSQLIFGTFNVGFWAAILLAFVWLIPLIKKRYSLSDFKKLLASAGFLAFIVIYIIVFVFDLFHDFSVWDELTHWGMMVKEMARLDKFYYIEASNLLVHKDYPPMLSLLELFWTKLCGGFSEPAIECALHTFMLSLLVPFLPEETISRKSFWQTATLSVLFIVLITLTILLFDGHGVVDTIYIDYTVAILVTFLLLTIFYSSDHLNKFEIVTLIIGGSFLILSKQIGLPFYLIVILFLVIKNKIKLSRRTLIVAGALILAPVVFWLLWHLVTINIPGQFDSASFGASSIISALTSPVAWQKLALANFLTALGTKSITNSSLQLSFVQTIILFALFAYFSCHKNQATIRRQIPLIISLLLGALGYTTLVLLLYLTSFGEVEGPALASFDRYFGTFGLILILPTVVIFLRNQPRRQLLRSLTLITAVLALLISSNTYAKLYPYIFPREHLYSQYQLTAEEINGELPQDTKNPHVLLVSPNCISSGAHFFVEYYATPIKIECAETIPLDNSSYALIKKL